MNETALEGLNEAYGQHQDLLILALTGQTGSGCSTAAKILCTDPEKRQTHNFEQNDPEKRKQKIIQKFSDKNKDKFKCIQVSSLFIGFMASITKSQLGEINNSLDDEHKLTIDQISGILDILAKSNIDCSDAIKVITGDYDEEVDRESVIFQIKEKLPSYLSDIKNRCGNKYGPLLQTIGDNIRKSGNCHSSSIDSSKLFTLPKSISRIIEVIRCSDIRNKENTRIVIDAIRSPTELTYLRDRYSPLYVVAITADDKERRNRLVKIGCDQRAINSIDAKEYPPSHNPLSSYEKLVSQDIQTCLQKADIYINNPGDAIDESSKSKLDKQTSHLGYQLFKYCSLALRPGLVTPTRNERCMQIAFTAKANSGCISRQVGAAIADENYSIVSIGWNDVPRGQIPCALRSVNDLKSADDTVAYSELERTSDELRNFILDTHKTRSDLDKKGINCAFCVKDAINGSIKKSGDHKGNNQVHTRALHAEENAFLQLARFGSNLPRSKLYTTASPCELCSKKAYQMGVAEVIYIDPYPGISVSQILTSGHSSHRPTLSLFSGATGKAYHRLYEPMFPIKDEISLYLNATTESDSLNPIG